MARFDSRPSFTAPAAEAYPGYASESSFSHGFQRITGTAPGRYRRTARTARARRLCHPGNRRLDGLASMLPGPAASAGRAPLACV